MASNLWISCYTTEIVKDGVYYCYYAFVLRISSTQISYGCCIVIQGYFCAVQNYVEKTELSKCSWYPKRKLGVTMHFSELIKLQFGKDCHTLPCILKLFTNIVDYLSSKNAWLHPIIFGFQ